MSKTSISLVVVSVAVSLGCTFFAAYAFSRRKVRGAFSFALLMAAAAIYTVGYALEISQRDLPSLLVAIRFEYLGLAFIPGLWLLFAHRYALPKPPGVPFFIAVFVPAVLAIILFWTDEFHHLYYATLSLRRDLAFPVLVFTRGPAGIVFPLYLLLGLAGGSALLLRQAFRQDRWRRRQSLFIALGSLIPLATSLLYLLGVFPPGFDPGSYSIALSAFVIAWAFFRLGFLDLVPAARALAIDALSDGFLVLDERGRLADANPAARSFLGPLTMGELIPATAAGGPGLRELAAKGEGKIEFLSEGPVESRRLLDARMFPVYDPRGRRSGSALILRDITETAALLARLADLASTDALTGILNRRRFYELGYREFDLARRAGRVLSVAILDIDHFKKVNDSFGHPAGDEVLRELCRRIGSKLRSSDVFCRYGGEEFAFLFPDTTPEGALRVAERLRLLMAAEPVLYGDTTIAIEVSIGVCGASPGAEASLDLYLARADEALYLAKDGGRNRVVLWQGPENL